MPVKRRAPKGRAPKYHPLLFVMLRDGLPLPPERDDHAGQVAWLEMAWMDSPLPREAWTAHGDEIMRDWIATAPGTRPWGWWEFEAPRWVCDRLDGHFLQGKLSEPREQVGGSGRPHDAYGPSLTLGVHNHWLDFLPDDPPRVESQAAYLLRHGLMTEAERKRLPADAFEPEPVMEN